MQKILVLDNTGHMQKLYDNKYSNDYLFEVTNVFEPLQAADYNCIIAHNSYIQNLQTCKNTPIIILGPHETPLNHNMISVPEHNFEIIKDIMDNLNSNLGLFHKIIMESAKLSNPPALIEHKKTWFKIKINKDGIWKFKQYLDRYVQDQLITPKIAKIMRCIMEETLGQILFLSELEVEFQFHDNKTVMNFLTNTSIDAILFFSYEYTDEMQTWSTNNKHILSFTWYKTNSENMFN